jgi:hypothetical protein
MAMQKAASHNAESDAIQLSDEYRAVDVPLSFTLPLLLSIHHPIKLMFINLYDQLTKIAFKKQTPPFAY